MLVVDASVMAPAVADGGEDGQGLRIRLKGKALACPLLTADIRLANAPGSRCTIEVL